MDFCGDGTPLSEAGLNAAAGQLGLSPAALWAVVRVETRGWGFLADRRPQILFERHIFHRETQGAFDATAPEISDPSPGGYGASGAHQYDRLAAAIALDRQAALRSASWGIGQIMGFHASTLGFGGVDAMVTAMVESEDLQLHAMTRFIGSAGLDAALKQCDWARFARGYNGAGYASNQYDTKLARAYADLATKGLPDLRVRAAQLYLTYRGHAPGAIDGIIGDLTRLALKQFQETAGLKPTGELDDTTLARLAVRS
jgi:N-acetylmuramidase-like protein/putative peptidoglycan binding protein